LLVDLLTQTGCRIAELSALRICEINLREREPYIHIKNGKGGHQRIVYISKTLAQHLKDFIRQEQLQEQDHLLVSSHKKAYTTRGLQKNFKRCLIEAGLSLKYSCHSCRHTFATQLYKKSGHNLRLVQKALGHQNISTTQIYADVTKSDMAKAVQNLF